MRKKKAKLAVSATVAAVGGVLLVSEVHAGIATSVQFDEYGRAHFSLGSTTSESQVKHKKLSVGVIDSQRLGQDEKKLQKFREFWLANNGTCKGNGQCCCSNPKIA